MELYGNEIEKALSFIDEWVKNNGSVINEGIKDSSKLEKFMKDFGGYIDGLDYTPLNGGDKLILYADNYGNVGMWRYAQGASNTNIGYYFISDTIAGKLLNSDDIQEKIFEICSENEDLFNQIFGNPVNGNRSRFVEGQLAINDRVSANLVKHAKGDVTIWAPNAPYGKVLTDTELKCFQRTVQPVVLEYKNRVMSIIDGICTVLISLRKKCFS